MTRRDIKLTVLGAAPAVVIVILMIALLVSRPASPAVRVLAFAGILAATVFPAFANMMRVSRSR